MPAVPQRIAVISAEGAAGYGDFIKHLEGNAEGFVFYPFLIPAAMQGDRTSESVRSALAFIETTIDLWDCVAIVRGGGATTDLNGFDDYELARAVATFPLPVVVGIGHERDRTVLDEIAHTRLKTPTAVAAFFVDTLRVAYNRVGNLIDTIITYSKDRLSGEQRMLANVEALLPSIAEAPLLAAKANLDREMSRLPVIVDSKISREHLRMDSFRNMVRIVSSQQTSRAEERLNILSARIPMLADNILRRAADRLSGLADLVSVLSPDNTLRRGYSITRHNGVAVTDTSKLTPGTKITTQLLNGSVESVVS